MKIFKTNKMILVAFAAMVIIAGALQSCNSEMDAPQGVEKQTVENTINNVILNDIERNKIKKSNEFEEYIEANIELYSSVLKVDSCLKNTKSTLDYVISIDGKKIKKKSCSLDNYIINDSKNKTIKLIEKFPEIKKLGKIQFVALIRSTIIQSEKLQKLIAGKKLGSNSKRNVRQKTSAYEGGTTTYNSAWEAFLYASLYSNLTQNECSGYVFGDGSALLYINPNATHGSTSYPLPVYNQTLGGIDITIYDGNVVQSTFHTQFNSPVFSTPTTTGATGNDQSAQSNYFPNSSLIIIYQGTAYEYDFQYGFYIP